MFNRYPPLTYKLDPLTASYIAGIMDGEGSIYIEQSNRLTGTGKQRYRIVVAVMMCDRQALDFIGNATGKEPFTKALPKGRATKRNFAYGLTWRNNPAAYLLKELLPFMKVKSMQARLALRFQEVVAKPWGVHFTEEDFTNCALIKKLVGDLNNGLINAADCPIP